LTTASGETISCILGGNIILMSLVILPTFQIILIISDNKKFEELKKQEKQKKED